MLRFLRSFVLAVLAVQLIAGTSHVAKQNTDPLANKLFGAHQAASQQKPKVFGYYAKGCLAGAQQLPETGATWQAMRLKRNRNWGHPDLVSFIIDLSQQAKNLGWAGLYIGDMAQPRGGPMTSSHASHQTGLDVDIWMLPPRRLNLSHQDREIISSIPVRSDDQRSITKNWTPIHMEVLKAAAKDKRVERIFVAAAVKIEMCNKAGRDRKWLKKIRPLSGHHTHFHVRLKCPKGSPKCVKQTPVRKISKGDGCDESLTWWVTDYLDRSKPDVKKKKTKKKKKKVKAKPRPRRAREMIMADLPRQCMGVLKSK